MSWEMCQKKEKKKKPDRSLESVKTQVHVMWWF